MFFLSGWGSEEVTDPSDSDEAGSIVENTKPEPPASEEAAGGSVWGFFGGESPKEDAVEEKKDEPPESAPGATGGGWFSWGGGGEVEETPAEVKKDDIAVSEPNEPSESPDEGPKPETLEPGGGKSDDEGTKKKEKKSGKKKSKKQKSEGKDSGEESELRTRKSGEFATDEAKKDAPPKSDSPTPDELPPKEDAPSGETQQERKDAPAEPEKPVETEASSGGGFWGFFGGGATEEPPAEEPSDAEEPSKKVTDKSTAPVEDSSGGGWGFFSSPQANDSASESGSQKSGSSAGFDDLNKDNAPPSPDPKDTPEVPQEPPKAATDASSGFGWGFLSPTAAEGASDSEDSQEVSPSTPPPEPTLASGGWGFFGFGGGAAEEPKKEESQEKEEGEPGAGEGTSPLRVSRFGSGVSCDEKGEDKEKRKSKKKGKGEAAQESEKDRQQEVSSRASDSGDKDGESREQSNDKPGGEAPEEDGSPEPHKEAETKDSDSTQKETAKTTSPSRSKSKPAPPRNAKAKPPPLRPHGSQQETDLPTSQGFPGSREPQELVKHSSTASSAGAVERLEQDKEKGVPQDECHTTDPQTKIDGEVASPPQDRQPPKKKPPPPKPASAPPSTGSGIPSYPSQEARTDNTEGTQDIQTTPLTATPSQSKDEHHIDQNTHTAVKEKEQKKEPLSGEIEGKAGKATVEKAAAKKKAPPPKSLPGPPGGKKGAPGVKPEGAGEGAAAKKKATVEKAAAKKKAPPPKSLPGPPGGKKGAPGVKPEGAGEGVAEGAKEEPLSKGEEEKGEKKDEEKEEKKEPLSGEAEGKAGEATVEKAAAKKKAPPPKSLPGPPGGKKGAPGVKPEGGGEGVAEGAKEGPLSMGEEEKGEKKDEEKEEKKEPLSGEAEGRAGEATAKLQPMKALPGPALPKKGLPPVKAGEAGKAAPDTAEGPRAGEEAEPEAAAKAGEADAKTVGPKLAMPAAKAKLQPMKALPGPALPKKGLPPVKAGEAGKAAPDTAEGPRAGEEAEPEAAAKAGEADAKTVGPKLAMPAAKAKLQPMKALPGPALPKKGLRPSRQPEPERVLKEGNETEAKDAGRKLTRPPAKTTLPAPKGLSHPVLARKAVAPVKAGDAGKAAADAEERPRDGEPEPERGLKEVGQMEGKDAGPKVVRPPAKPRLVAPKGLLHPILAKKAVVLVEAGESGEGAEDTKEGVPEREAAIADAAAKVREADPKAVGPKVSLPPLKATLLAPKGLSHPVLAKKTVAPVKAGDVGMSEQEVSEVAAPSATSTKAVSRDLCKVATELAVQATRGVSVPTLPVKVLAPEKPMEERQDNDISQNKEAKARQSLEGGEAAPTAAPLRKGAPKSSALVGNLPVLVSPKRRVSVEELATAKSKLGLSPVDETPIPRADGADTGAPKAEGQPLTDGMGVYGVHAAVTGPPGAKLPSAPVVTASLTPVPAAVKQTEPTVDRKPFEVSTAPVEFVSRPFASQSGTQPKTPQLSQQGLKPATSPGFTSGSLAEVLKPGAFMAVRAPTDSTRTRQESDRLAVPSTTAVSRSIDSREALASPLAGASDQEVCGSANSAQLLTSGRLSVTDSKTGSASARTSLSSRGVGTSALQMKADLRIEQSPTRGPPAESGSLSPSHSSYVELLTTSIPVAKRTAPYPVGDSSLKIITKFREQATLSLQAVQAPQEPSGPPSPAGGTPRLSPFHRVFSDSARPFRTTSRGAYSHSERLSGVPPTPESATSGLDGAGDDSPSVEAKPSMLGKFIKTDGTAVVPLPGPHEPMLSRALPASLRSTPRAGKHQMKSQALGVPAPVLSLGKSGGEQPIRHGVKEIDHVVLDSVYVQGCPASLSDAFSNSLFPQVDLDAVPTGTCVFDLGPRAVMACSGPVYSMAHHFLPDSQRQIEDVEAQLQIAAEVEGAFGIYDAPDGVYPWGDSEVNTAGNNSTSVTKLPKVLFGAAVTAWNEMLVYRRPQLILLIGTDVKAWDVAVPRLVVDLLSLGNLSLGLDSATARYMHDAHHLLQLFESVRPVEDGTFSEEARLPNTGLHRWDIHFTPEGAFSGASVSAWLLDLPGLCGASDGMRQEILLRFAVGVLDKEEFFLGPHFPCGCLRPFLDHDVASFSLTDEERERIATECADLLVQVLKLDESQVVAIIKTFLAVSILARENSCTSDESITMAAHLLGVSASDLGGHFRTALESPHLEAANLGSAVARTLYRQLFQFIVARINAVLQHMSQLGNRTFNAYVRTPFSISVLAGPTELDALPTVSIGKLGCYAAQAVGLCFAFRGLLYLQKLLFLGKFALPDYLNGLGKFTPANVFSEAVLLPDSGLLPFVASGPKSKQDILAWFDNHGSSAGNQDLNFFSCTFELASDSYLEVSLPGKRIKLDVSEAAFSSQPLDPLIVNVCNFVIKQSEPIRRLRLAGITRNSGLQGSESHLLYASLQDAWNPLLDSRPIVLHRGTRDGWSSLSESLDAVQQWEQHGFPLFIVIKDLPKYCPNLFPQDCEDDVDRLMYFLPAYIDIDGVLFGSSLLAVRSQEYEGLQRLQEEAAEVVAKRQAWLVEIMELDSEIRDIVREQEHGDTQQMEVATHRLRQPSPELRTSLIPLSQWGTLQEAAKRNADILDLEDDHVSEYEVPTPGARRGYYCISPVLSARLEQGSGLLQTGSSGKQHWEQGAGRQQSEATKNSVRLPSHTYLKLNSQELATTPAGSGSVNVPASHTGLPQLPAGSSVVMGRSPRAGYSTPIGDSLTLTDRIAPLPGAFGVLPATPKPPAVAKLHSPRASGVAQQIQVSPRKYEATSERAQPKGAKLGASSALVEGVTKYGEPPLIPPVMEALTSPRASSVTQERQRIAGRSMKVSQGASVQNMDLEERQRLAEERERLIHENELLQIENQRLTTENLRLENERLHEENLKLTRQQCRLKSSVASGDKDTAVDFVSTPTQEFEGSPAPVCKSPAAAPTAPVSAMPTPKSPQEASEAQDRPQAPLSPAPDVSAVENRRAQESSMTGLTAVVPKTKNPPDAKPAGAAVETTPAKESSVTRLKAVAPKPKPPLSKAVGGSVTEDKTAKDLSATPIPPTPEAPLTAEVDGVAVEDTRAMETSVSPAEAVAPPPEAPSSGETGNMTVDDTTAKELPVSPVAGVAPKKAAGVKQLLVPPKKAATPPLSQIPKAKVPPAKEQAVVRYSHSPSPVVQQIENEEPVEEPLSADSPIEQAFPRAEDVESIPEHADDVGVDDAAADVTDLQNECGDLEEVETVSFEDDTDVLAKGMRAVWVQAAFSGVWKGVLYWPKHLEKLAREMQESSDASQVKQTGKASVELTASAFFNSFVDTAKATDERDRQLLVSAGPVGDFPQPRGTIHITRGKIRGREAGHVGQLVQPDDAGRRGSVSPPPGSSHGERRQRFGETSLMRSSDYRGSPVPRDRQREGVPLQLIQGFFSFDSSGQGGPSVGSPGLNLSDLEGTWNGRVVWKPPAKEYGDAAQDLSTIILVDLTQPDGGVPDPRGPLHVFRSDNDGAPRPIAVPQTGETIAKKLKTIFSTIDVSGVPLGAGNVYFIPPNQSGVLAITAHSNHRDTGLCIQEPDDQITTFANYGERRRKEQHDDVMRRLEEADKACTFRPKLISGGGWRSTRKTAPEVSSRRTSGIPAS
ncbi:UNVERIFIED_CONTAM: hypothetical protein HHA_224540 [Hammondia hammondi]|eukprot:XP_008881829.1 hypothetical protein HHA_224540 [Hammondia hammondi]